MALSREDREWILSTFRQHAGPTEERVRGIVREEIRPVRDALIFMASRLPGSVPGRKSHVVRKVERIFGLTSS